MAEPRPLVTDERIEQFLGNLLRTGVITAALVVLAGGVFYLTQHGDQKPDLRVFHGEEPELRSVTGIVRDALTLDSKGIIQFGLLLLVATPIARVIFSVIGFTLERDFRYVTITLVVLTVLLWSVAGGLP